ncbi:hypothetical protein [Streptomyces sp. NPDC045369]|uniref:hypothetical protein n=1 Tax=Streptomyces sp. NPDC045369 TaxID=3155732 RepID=UPI0033D8CBBD
MGDPLHAQPGSNQRTEEVRGLRYHQVRGEVTGRCQGAVRAEVDTGAAEELARGGRAHVGGGVLPGAPLELAQGLFERRARRVDGGGRHQVFEGGVGQERGGVTGLAGRPFQGEQRQQVAVGRRAGEQDAHGTPSAERTGA